jgi:hypothetical protein
MEHSWSWVSFLGWMAGRKESGVYMPLLFCVYHPQDALKMGTAGWNKILVMEVNETIIVSQPIGSLVIC